MVLQHFLPSRTILEEILPAQNMLNAVDQEMLTETSDTYFALYWYCTGTILYCTILYCTVLVLYYTVLYCTVLYRYYTVLCCAVLYWITCMKYIIYLKYSNKILALIKNIKDQTTVLNKAINITKQNKFFKII